MSSHEYTFEQIIGDIETDASKIDRAIVDPRVEHAAQLAKKFEDSFRSRGLVTDHDRRRLVRDLREATEIAGANVYVTGHVGWYSDDSFRPGVLVRHASLQSDGFDIVDLKEGEDARVVWRFLAHSHDGNTREVAAYLDGVHVQPVNMKFEQARAWLELYAPEALSVVDVTLDAVDYDECLALPALGQVNFTVADKEERVMFERSMASYIAERLNWDTKVPYSVEGAGTILRRREVDGRYEPYVSAYESIADLKEVIPVTLLDGDVPSCQKLYVKAELLLNPEEGSDGETVLISLDGVSRVVSLRRAYYGIAGGLKNHD